MIGEEEAQRQQEERARREREERAKAKAQRREQLAAGTRKIFKFLLGATVVLYLVVNGGRFQAVSGWLGERFSAKVNAHSTLKQNALKHQDEVDLVIK
jgi:hypothetical protein